MTPKLEEARRRLAVWIGAPGGDVDLHLWRTAHIASLASQGAWARLTSSYHCANRSSPGGTIEDRWTSLSLGFHGGLDSLTARDSLQLRSLWHILRDAGRLLAVRSYPQSWNRRLIPQTAEAVDWDVRLLLHATVDTEIDQGSAMPNAEQKRDLWASWDESLLPAVTESIPGWVNMIVALPRHSDARGLLVMQGDGVSVLGDLGTLDLLDIAPTVLSLFEIAIPPWMEGEAVDILLHDDYPLSDAEQELLQQHLSGLGYFG